MEIFFLIQKKGKPFMIHSERIEIIAGLADVSYVVGWDDPSATVTGALEIIQLISLPRMEVGIHFKWLRNLDIVN